MDTNNSPIAIHQIRVGRIGLTEYDAATPLTSVKTTFVFVQYIRDLNLTECTDVANDNAANL
jgi:hypothetical protein